MEPKLWGSRDFHKFMGWKQDSGTARRLRWTGGGPKYIKRGKRCLYDPADVQKWIDAQKRESTSIPPPRRGRAA